MTLKTKVILFVVSLSALLVIINVLPDASRYPYPEEDVNLAFSTFFLWMSAFNGIMPLDTLVQVAFFGIAAKGVIYIALPAMFWAFNRITRLVSGN